MAQSPAAPAPESPSTASDSPQEPANDGWGGLRRFFFGSGENNDGPSAPTDELTSKGDEHPADEGTTDAEPPPKAAPAATPAAPAPDAEKADDWKPPQTREEFEREVQREHDRREDKRKRDEDQRLRAEASKAQDARLQQLERDEDAAVNDGDLDRVREIKAERRTILAQVRQGHFVTGLLGGFDSALLLPLLEPLPQAEQEQIVTAIQDMEPLPGRTHAVKETLKRLETQWRADEAAKTRTRLKKDETFLREVRATMRDEEDEPDHVQGSPAAPTNGSISDWMKAQLALRRGG